MNYYKVSKKFKPKFKTKQIRLGKNFDGGYVVSRNAVLKSKNLISLGVYDDWSFESEFMEKNHAAKIFIFDGAVNFKFWIKYLIKNSYYFLIGKSSLKKLIENYFKLIQFPFFLCKSNINFYNKNILKHSTKIDLKKNSSITKVIQDNKLKNFFFKIDIEENEYEILKELIIFQNEIECLVIEFHKIDKNFKKIENFIKNFKLNLTHIHVNNYGFINKKGNPSVMEFTFVKKIYCKKNNSNVSFPLKSLDFPNNPEAKDLKVLFN